MRRADDDGAVTLWVLAACTVLVVVAVVVSARGLAVLGRHRLETAADLAALAAAGRIGIGGAPCAAAAHIAAQNGARLVSCTLHLDPGGRSGSVVVRVRAEVRLPGLGAVPVTAGARAGRERVGR